MTETPKRPYRSSIEVRRFAVDTILKEVKEWLGIESPNEEELREDLAKNADNDAYQFAQNLDRRGWSADYDLVEILSGYDDSRAWDKVCRDYVSMFGIEVPYAVGDIIMGRNEKLEVTDVRKDTAVIVARPIGDPQYANGGGYILNVEHVMPVPADA